ncbi:MAG: hypothetical protein M3P51_02385 [Chloroflexota bacterium]|nr:hypothetical protein [Chloroflexota bacterium]
MSEIVACRGCGCVMDRPARGVVWKCQECGGMVAVSSTAADRLRTIRRQAEREGLVERRHISQLPRQLIEASRRQLEEQGALPRGRR